MRRISLERAGAFVGGAGMHLRLSTDVDKLGRPRLDRGCPLPVQLLLQVIRFGLIVSALRNGRVRFRIKTRVFSGSFSNTPIVTFEFVESLHG